MLVGRETAIIPVGLSCQPTAQLIRLNDVLSQLVCDDLHYESSFLNWVISTAEGIAEFFERFSDEKITANHIIDDQRLELAGAKIWIMHEHAASGPKFCKEDFERIATKFEHMRNKLFALRQLKNRTFVICQGDNNLTSHYMWDDGRMDFTFDRARLNRIKSSIDHAFPYGQNRLVVMGLRGRINRVDWSYPTVILEPDNSEWGGDDAQWDAAAELIANGRGRLPLLPAHWGRPAIEVAPLPESLSYPATDERLKTIVGRRMGAVIRFDGSAGGGLYGPYIRLGRGVYEIAIRFESAYISGSAVMDVTGGAKIAVLAERQVRSSNLIGRDAKLRVILSRDTINVEVRLWCLDGFAGAVESVTIKRVPT